MDLREVKEFILDISQYIITFLIFIFVLIYILSLQLVIGSSMQPTLMDRDIILVSKSHYRFTDIQRTEIISFENEKGFLIKRVVALPGETVEIKNNQIYVNGKKLNEPYLKNENFIIDDFAEIALEQKEYFVLGDARDNSLDSRTFGPVKKDEIIGRVIAQVWPITKFQTF